MALDDRSASFPGPQTIQPGEGPSQTKSNELKHEDVNFPAIGFL